ncbi:MAG: lytic murein transglycosylase B [Granulosicoccus sp.]
MTAKNLLCLVSACVVVLGAGRAYATELFLERESVRQYIKTLSVERDLDEARITQLFTDLESQDSILEAISRPAERRLTWREYRPIFIKQKRIDLGRQFLADHSALLARAENEYGVPQHIIAAIIGVETFYGRITGKHGVLESLATLAFDYPPRATFFRAELGEFLALSESEGWDTASLKGSYAGAMGLPQFISSSYREYSVDFDGDGRRDLFNSTADAIGSVANYLARHGWVEGAPIAARWSQAKKGSTAFKALLSDSLKPSVTPESVKKLGFDSPSLTAGTADGRLLSVMLLKGAKGEEAWVGYKNFYAITRYNHSRLYAMAVIQLADALRESSS